MHGHDLRPCPAPMLKAPAPKPAAAHLQNLSNLKLHGLRFPCSPREDSTTDLRETTMFSPAALS